MFSSEKRKASFSENGTLSYLTSGAISFFVLNCELDLCGEVHALISNAEEEELGCLVVLTLSG